MKGISAVFAVFVLCLFSVVTGFRSFQHQIPNGNKVKHPCRRGADWPTVGHAQPSHTPIKNLFGDDWKQSGFDWKAVCRLDSDGDGLTNGEELGDPDCEWEFGMRPKFPQPRGHPGFCDQDREVCTTDDRAIERECRNIRFRRVPPKGRPSQSQTRPRRPPPVGNDHPQTHLTKRERLQGRPTPPRFGGPTAFPMPGRTQPGRSQPGFPPQVSSVPRVPGVPPRVGQSIFPGVSGVPGTLSVPQRFPGLERMVGMSVFGTRPRQDGMFPPGMGTFRPGSASGVSGTPFTGARSPGFMGAMPWFFRDTAPGGGTIPTGSMGPTDGGMPAMGSVSGVVPRTPGMQMSFQRFPFGATGFLRSSPGGMMGTEGRVPGASGSSPTMFGAYSGRGRMRL